MALYSKEPNGCIRLVGFVIFIQLIISSDKVFKNTLGTKIQKPS